MRQPARYLVLVACLALIGSVAHAAPARRRGKVSKKVEPRAEVEPPVERVSARDDDRDDDDDRYNGERRFNADIDRSDDDRDDDDAAEVRPARVKVRAPRAKDWQVAIGPYLWASSVEADVSIGGASVGAGIDFMEMKRHARYGAEVIAEARYRRFAITGDLMYGVVDVNGDKEVGPVTVGLTGTASSLLVDGATGYMLAGDDHAPLALEVRAGVRYQRTKVAGAVGIGGSDVASTVQVMAGADALAGARVFVRPVHWFFLSGTVDVGVFGTSTLTWSAAADASLRVTSRVLLSLGWRTLTMNGANVSVVMHGPRAAAQLLF